MWRAAAVNGTSVPVPDVEMRPMAKVPDEIFDAFVVSVVADVASPGADILPVVGLTASGPDALTANVPEVFGSVSVGDPAMACVAMVAVPDVAPLRARLPCAVPATPSVRAPAEIVALAPPEMAVPVAA